MRRDPATLPIQDVGNAFVVVLRRVARRFPEIDIQDYATRIRIHRIARRLVADSPCDLFTSAPVTSEGHFEDRFGPRRRIGEFDVEQAVDGQRSRPRKRGCDD